MRDYKTNNVLKTKVASCNIAEALAGQCRPLFGKITGAWLPADDGSEQAIE